MRAEPFHLTPPFNTQEATSDMISPSNGLGPPIRREIFLIFSARSGSAATFATETAYRDGTTYLDVEPRIERCHRAKAAGFENGDHEIGDHTDPVSASRANRP
jgi:hypothetical protein